MFIKTGANLACNSSTTVFSTHHSILCVLPNWSHKILTQCVAKDGDLIKLVVFTASLRKFLSETESFVLL